MKVQNKISMFILLFFLSFAAIWVHAETENAEEPDTTQEVETTEENTEPKPELNDPKVTAEVEKKVTEVLEKVTETIEEVKELAEEESANEEEFDIDKFTEKIKNLFKDLEDIEGVDVKFGDPTDISEEDGVKVYTYGPYVYSKTLNGEDLESGELANIVKELLETIETDPKKLLESDNVKIFKFDPSGSSKMLTDSDVEKLTEEFKKLLEDEGVDTEKLSEKIKAILKKHKFDSSAAIGMGGVKGIVIESSGSTENLKDIKELKDLEIKIKALTEDQEMDADELADAVKKLVEGKLSGSATVLDKDNVKVVEFKPFMSTKTTDESKEIDDIKKRIDQLETKIDKLIEKLDTSNTQSSENQK